jgi:hypothetical protein
MHTNTQQQTHHTQVRDKPCRVVDIRIRENPGYDSSSSSGSGDAAAAAGGRGGGGNGSGGSGRGRQGLAAGDDGGPKPLRLKREILDRELDRVYEATTLTGMTRE